MTNKESIVKNLTGHSGCKIDLMSAENDFFVRKMSGDSNYNRRLKKQFIKQYKFDSKTIFTPQIINKGTKNNLFYFDMEYVQCKTLAEYTSSILITEIADFIRLLFKNLYYENCQIISETNMIFKKKIADLKAITQPTPNTIKAFHCLDKFDWSYVFKSPCHGDLTLENILITPSKKLYLIDFLDSFYNSWLIDIAKLLQDLELGWSFRKKEANATRSLRLLVAKEALLEEVGKLADSDKILESIYYVLLLNVLRIYAYTKDEETFLFLECATEKVLGIIDNIGKEVLV